MFARFRPKPSLEQADIDHGLRLLLVDGVSTQVMTALTSGAFLIAYALSLGASNTAIGFIAAVGPLTQALQLPAILLIERTRRRKLLAVTSSLAARSLWLLIAALPFLLGTLRLPVLLALVLLHYAFATVASCAFNSWKRDLVPEAIMGRYLAKRLTLATAAAALITFGAGWVLDHGAALLGDARPVYSVLFAVGAVAGLVGVFSLSRVAEPEMPAGTHTSFLRMLSAPLKDQGFQKLLVFLASWNFAVGLAQPFFSVYMIKTLELPMTWVLGLSVTMQVTNVLFFRIWGRLADRFGNRAVMSVSGLLFVLTIVAWPFTTLPEKYFLTVPLLIGIHVLAGVGTAGVNLAAAGLALKAAPRGQATAFLAVNAITSGAAASVAPILGGLLSDAFAGERVTLDLRWRGGAHERAHLTAIDLAGLDFLFVLAFLFGLYALHRLLAVKEEGEVQEDVVVSELYGEIRRAVREVTEVTGVQKLADLPQALRDQRARRDTRGGGTTTQ
jgi:MFS family permease